MNGARNSADVNENVARCRYNMSLSTAIEPCNYSGLFDLDFAAKFGYVDWDWSNGKNVWANKAPMACEETLKDAAEQTHKRNPESKVFIYRNLVKVGRGYV